jgi:hypothetical protein
MLGATPAASTFVGSVVSTCESALHILAGHAHMVHKGVPTTIGEEIRQFISR